MKTKRLIPIAALVALIGTVIGVSVYVCKEPENYCKLIPLMRVADLDIGEFQTVELSNGAAISVKLIELHEVRDNVCNAVRRATVKVEVAGRLVSLVSSTYHLPVTAGAVQIDCPVTQGYVQSSRQDNIWGLTKAARVRLWPADSPLIRPGTFVYPVKQRWFASDTQMANVPAFVNGGEIPDERGIYYHYGLDFGGAESMVEVVSATDGQVISSGNDVLPGYDDCPVFPRKDVIYILDDRGWFCRYSHFYEIDGSIKPGAQVCMGQRLGLLGKEGIRSGWSHLHFDINARQHSGLWGTVNGYPFIWEAYQRQYQPEIIAVARPHCISWAGEPVELDATRSWSRCGTIDKFEWTFCDGTAATGPKVIRTYKKPGGYNEILKITDARGNVDYDFAVVRILDKANPDQTPPTIHAAYYPTFDIKPGEVLIFQVCTFRTTHGHETWDFGDGCPEVTVRSEVKAKVHNPQGYAVTKHAYRKQGDYIASVRRTNEYGHQAITHLHIRVGSQDKGSFRPTGVSPDSVFVP